MIVVQAEKVTSEEGVELRSVVCEPFQVLTLSDNPAFFSTLRIDRLQLSVAMFQLLSAPESYREEMSASVSLSSARQTLVRGTTTKPPTQKLPPRLNSLALWIASFGEALQKHYQRLNFRSNCGDHTHSIWHTWSTKNRTRLAVPITLVVYFHTCRLSRLF